MRKNKKNHYCKLKLVKEIDSNTDNHLPNNDKYLIPLATSRENFKTY